MRLRLFGLLALLLVTLAAMVAGCAGSSSGTGGGPGRVGSCSGQVFAPDGATPLPDARIYVPAPPSRAVITETRSGPDGNFILSNVPVGNPTIVIEKGQWTKTITVTVAENHTTPIEKSQTTLPNSGTGAPKIAVVTGSYDHMEKVLKSMGVTFDLFNGGGSTGGQPVQGTGEQLFETDARLNGYDMVFLNCGSDIGNYLEDPVKSRIRNFVQNGGTLYATDLESHVIAEVFPTAVTFAGSGTSGQTVEADVVDPTLRSTMQSLNLLTPAGKLHIEGFLSGWSVIGSVPDSTKVWVRGEVDFSGQAPPPGKHVHTVAAPGAAAREVRPLTVSFSVGAGKVIYTSYHTDHGSTSQTLTPQERLLGILAFEG